MAGLYSQWRQVLIFIDTYTQFDYLSAVKPWIVINMAACILLPSNLFEPLEIESNRIHNHKCFHSLFLPLWGYRNKYAETSLQRIIKLEL